MIKTPLSTVIGGAFWTPNCTIIGGTSKTFDQLIKSLFSNNEQGFAYDPNDLTTMFQDAMGTVPVTTAGQPVGLIRDKSGRNNHAFQTVSASRPILQRNATTGTYYLAFDGTDDSLVTNSIDFTVTDKVSLFAAYKNILPLTSYKLLLELSGNSDTTNGTFGIFAPALASDVGFTVSSRGTSQIKNNIINQPITQGLILSCSLSISPPLNVNKVNGVQAANNTAPQGIGNYGNYPIYIGRRAGNTNPFAGHLYGLIGIGRLTTDSESLALEKAIAKNIGVTLSV